MLLFYEFCFSFIFRYVFPLNFFLSCCFLCFFIVFIIQQYEFRYRFSCAWKTRLTDGCAFTRAQNQGKCQSSDIFITKTYQQTDSYTYIHTYLFTNNSIPTNKHIYLGSSRVYKYEQQNSHWVAAITNILHHILLALTYLLTYKKRQQHLQQQQKFATKYFYFKQTDIKTNIIHNIHF